MSAARGLGRAAETVESGRTFNYCKKNKIFLAITISIMAKYRSQNWFGKQGKDGFIYRAWMKNQGIPSHEFDGRPIIGICNTWSELTPCNAHFRELAESVKRGVSEAGGFPV